MIRVELIKLLRRPRTWVTIAALNALPTIVAILLAITDLGPRPGTGPPFLSAVLTDGTLFPLAALGIVLPLFLPVAVAVVGGDAIAGEVQSDTLRYLLVRPVARGRLLVAKLVSIVAFVVLATLVVAVVAYVEGKLFLGDAPTTGVVSISGSTLTETEMAAAHRDGLRVRRPGDARRRGDRAADEHAHRLGRRRRARHDRVPGRLDGAARARRGRLASSPTSSPATGSPSSTCSATRSAGATSSRASWPSWPTSPCSPAPRGPTSPPRTSTT